VGKSLPAAPDRDQTGDSLILTIPPHSNRYSILQLDVHGNIFSTSLSSAPPSAGGVYAFVASDYSGDLPQNATRVDDRHPDRQALVFGREPDRRRQRVSIQPPFANAHQVRPERRPAALLLLVVGEVDGGRGARHRTGGVFDDAAASDGVADHSTDYG
jgi:hypothetical protein